MTEKIAIVTWSSGSSAGGGGGKDGLGVGSIKDGKQVQDVGVSGSFLSDIKPQVSISRATLNKRRKSFN